MVTTTSACSASSVVRRCGRRSERATSSSRITSTTGGGTWPSGAGSEPADSAWWRPAAARSNSAALICERPALALHTNSAVAIERLLCGLGMQRGLRMLAADDLVGEGAERGTDQRADEVDPEVLPLPGGERGSEGA